jgi:predicted amidophosphoribosyltransferase
LDELDWAAELTHALNTGAVMAVLSRLSGPPSTGICRSCGDAIESQRLRANPQARHCSCCAAEEEAEARRARRCGPR